MARDDTIMESVLEGSVIKTGEAALVQLAGRGDHEAFAALVDGRLATTFRTCLAILGNESDARDATQDVFLRAWRSLPELREPESRHAHTANLRPDGRVLVAGGIGFRIPIGSVDLASAELYGPGSGR